MYIGQGAGYVNMPKFSSILNVYQALLNAMNLNKKRPLNNIHYNHLNRLSASENKRFPHFLSPFGINI